MNAKEFVKKYGVYIAGGVVLLYLVLKNATSGRAGAVAAANPNALELAKLQSSEKLAAGQFGLEQLRIQAALEAERIRAAAALEAARAAAALRNRELDIVGRQQSQGALNSILNAIANMAKATAGAVSGKQQGSSSGGSSSGSTGGWGTPPFNPSRSLPRAVEPSLGASIFNPPYVPEYPSEYSLPGFEGPGITFDSGPTFSDQFSGIDSFLSDFGDWSIVDSFSGFPEEARSGYYYTEAGSDFVYGYGEGSGDAVDPGGYSEEYYGFDFG